MHKNVVFSRIWTLHARPVLAYGKVPQKNHAMDNQSAFPNSGTNASSKKMEKSSKKGFVHEQALMVTN